MWSYKIVSKDSSDTHKKTSGKLSLPVVKERIFTKHLRKNSFKEGDIVYMQNGHKASIVNIEYNFDDVTWHNNLPYFLTIKDHTENKEYIAHYSILRKAN